MISPVKIWRRQREIRSLLGKEGVILTWTIIYTPGNEFKKYAPFPVAIVKLNSGENITAPVTECKKADLKKGRRVKVILRKVRDSADEDILIYGLKLKLI